MSDSKEIKQTQIPFYTKTSLLDSYIGMSNPEDDPVALKVIITALKSDIELRNYFFRSKPHPGWAKILWNEGFFQNPPELKQMKNGWQILRWEEQEYLLSIADKVPEILVEHLKILKENPLYGAKA